MNFDFVRLNDFERLKRKRHNQIYISILLDLWLVFFMVGAHYIGIFGHAYFNLGPNPDFIFFGAVIDTPLKYWSLLVFRTFGSVIEIVSIDTMMPFMNNYIHNNSDEIKLPFSRKTTWYIVQNHMLCLSVMQIFSVFMSLSQIDLALLHVIISQMILMIFTIPYWLGNKQDAKSATFV